MKIGKWSVDDNDFKEYCHLITHISLINIMPDIEDDCPMLKKDIVELENRRIDVHNKLAQQAGFEDAFFPIRIKRTEKGKAVYKNSRDASKAQFLRDLQTLVARTSMKGGF